MLYIITIYQAYLYIFLNKSKIFFDAFELLIYLDI